MAKRSKRHRRGEAQRPVARIARAHKPTARTLVIGVLSAITAVILISAISMAAGQRRYRQAEDRTESFQRMMDAGDIDSAVQGWETQRADDPDFPGSYLKLARAYTEHGQPSQAVVVLTSMADHNLDPPERRVALAVAYGKMKDPKSMAASLDAVHVAPHSWEAHIALMEAYAQVYDTAHALGELHEAERCEPSKAAIYALGAQYASAISDYATCEDQARRCLALGAGDGQTWFLLGHALANRPTPARLQEASNDLKNSTSIDPSAFAPWLELGDVDLKLGRVDSARDSLEEARTLTAAMTSTGVDHTKLLQNQVRIDHLLLQVYERTNDTVRADLVRSEGDTLNQRIQKG